MTERHVWGDARRAAERLTPNERCLLLLLTRLPFVYAQAMVQLSGLRGGAAVYRQLAKLRAAGLVESIHPSVWSGRSAALLYLSDLGLATVALNQGVDPEHLAGRGRLRRSDLLSLLSGLPQLLAVYELLAAVAASCSGRPNLLAWERPWRYRYDRPTTKTPVTVTLPAYAALDWGDERASRLLIPDLATFPVQAYRTTLSQLLPLRAMRDGDLPPLLIATANEQRGAAWKRLLDDISEVRREMPLAGQIVTWSEVRERLVLEDETVNRRHPVDANDLIWHGRLRPISAQRDSRPVPQLIGASLQQPRRAQPLPARLGQVILDVTAADYALLDVVGLHPFLPLENLATVLGWTPAWARYRRNLLIAQGLMRLVEPDELRGHDRGRELAELTTDGARLVAARQGLRLRDAVRHNGLTGGGPDTPIGPRRALLRNLEHTRGADAIFVRLCRISDAHAGSGDDDGLLEWRNASACSRHRIRPDGYGVYRHAGTLYGFFLEYNRGSMNGRDYRDKFASYYAYRDGGIFQRDYDGFPTILVVTTAPEAEERIALALRAVGVGREPPLPILMTTTNKIDDNRDGLLGPIWRELDTAVHVRRHWFARPV